MEQFLNCLYGPRLYSIIDKFMYYEPNAIEKFGDRVLQILSLIKICTMYASPIIIFTQRNNIYNHDNFNVLFKFTFIFIFAYTFGSVFKGVGRLVNLNYIDFLQAYKKHQNSKFEDKKNFLRKFDFDLKSWEPDYQIFDKPAIDVHYKKHSNDIPHWKRYSYNIFSYLATHSFALQMAYPGCTKVMNYLLGSVIIDGRFKLLTRHKGQRAKIRVFGGDDVDTMFIDKRREPSFMENVTQSDNGEDATSAEPIKESETPKKQKQNDDIGNFLLIVCEGNASFYEMGCTSSFLKTGLSILGWNHPGFAASTGRPFPETELAFIDGVVQYAVNVLGFPESKIIFYAWSIGCFTAAYASMRHPANTALVLDAAFDDILPLAINRMPHYIESLVTYTVRRYLDLRTLQYLIKNPSHNIIFIRRTEDEIMNTQLGDISTNRINRLALKTFQKRYPNLFTPDIVRIVKSVLRDRLVLKDGSIAYSNESENEHTPPPPTFSNQETLANYESQHLVPVNKPDQLNGHVNVNDSGANHVKEMEDMKLYTQPNSNFNVDNNSINDDNCHKSLNKDNLNTIDINDKNFANCTSSESEGEGERPNNIDKNSKTPELPQDFPFTIGYNMPEDEKLKTALKLVQTHFYDYEGSHCDPLPKHFLIDIISRFWNGNNN